MQFVYDIETYPNYFCLVALHSHSDHFARFELSEYRDDSESFFEFLGVAEQHRLEGVGFNSLGFDYPVLHHMIHNREDCKGVEGAQIAYRKADLIINSESRFGHMLWPDQRFFPQLDLYKLNHFDNRAKSTSLKALQFTMRSKSVEDLPIAPGTYLTAEQAKITGDYCEHDVTETKRFKERCEKEIEFRRSLVDEFGPEAMNWSDVKIGAEKLLRRLDWDACYYKDDDGKRQPRQTPRQQIDLRQCIFDYITFERYECNQLLERFKDTKVVDTKASISDSVTLDGFTFDFGTGGIHGAKHNSIYRADDDHVIIDADVTSLYPSIAIVNKLAPEHLGEQFCTEYAALKAERLRHAKGTPENAALKLALNGTYGNSNNPWSPFLDPKFTMTITVNGQLMLLMLAERLLAVPSVELIQINTDGVTFRCRKDVRDQVDTVCTEWSRWTCLDLEYAEYSAFYGRDVNSYIAQYTDGKLKSKGAYWYPKQDSDYNGWWHKDFSALVVQRAVEAVLVRGADLETFIREHDDPFDFMCRYKTPGGSVLVHGVSPEIDQQRVTRYYVAKDGQPLVKKSPPPKKPWVIPGAYKRKSGITDQEYYSIARTLKPDEHDERIHTKNRSRYEDRRISVCQSAMICNNESDFDFTAVDYDWYITEAKKLIEILEERPPNDTD